MDNWASFYNGLMISKKLIAVAALCKTWVWGRSHAGIVGSNSAGGGRRRGGGMDVCLL